MPFKNKRTFKRMFLLGDDELKSLKNSHLNTSKIIPMIQHNISNYNSPVSTSTLYGGHGYIPPNDFKPDSSRFFRANTTFHGEEGHNTDTNLGNGQPDSMFQNPNYNGNENVNVQNDGGGDMDTSELLNEQNSTSEWNAKLDNIKCNNKHDNMQDIIKKSQDKRVGKS